MEIFLVNCYDNYNEPHSNQETFVKMKKVINNDDTSWSSSIKTYKDEINLILLNFSPRNLTYLISNNTFKYYLDIYKTTGFQIMLPT